MNPNFRQPPAVPERRTQIENREFRKKSLLRAAIHTVARYDISGATVERICEEAGASRGLIAHYFDSKDALLMASLQNWFDQSLAIKKAIVNDVSMTPEQQLRALVNAGFQAPSYSWEHAAAWQAFTNASRHDPLYAKPIQLASRYVIRLMVPLFQAAGVREDCTAREAATHVYLLTDGLWNSLATGKDSLTLKQARRFCDASITGYLCGAPGANAPTAAGKR